jgi:type III restriction enzyme
MVKKKKALALPAFEELQKLKEPLNDEEYGRDVPSYISNGLKHTLRPYQHSAIYYYHMTQVTDQFKYRNMNHVLFNMATGSGKTDIMAALILYLFKEQGYQNFLFVVNTNGVLTKTIDNLTNTSSIKYLFSQVVEIEG